MVGCERAELTPGKPKATSVQARNHQTCESASFGRLKACIRSSGAPAVLPVRQISCCDRRRLRRALADVGWRSRCSNGAACQECGDRLAFSIGQSRTLAKHLSAGDEDAFGSELRHHLAGGGTRIRTGIDMAGCACRLEYGRTIGGPVPRPVPPVRQELARSPERTQLSSCWVLRENLRAGNVIPARSL
jgi:hypothetical protein